jgi:hypothetical protein
MISGFPISAVPLSATFLAADDVGASLSWLPHYPDYLRPPRRLPTTSQRFLVFDANPIPRPAPPTELTWHPTYPDVTRAKTSVRPSQIRLGTSFIGVPFLDLRWKAVYPNRLNRLQLPTADQRFAAAPDWSFLAVPTTGGWRPTYPDRLNRLLPVRTGARLWVVDPHTLITATGCIEWTEETIVSPLLTTEAVVSPMMIEETLVSPTLTEEDLC